MSTGQIFFSYSRVDSAFALRVANDLRACDADVWIDQTDIAPGVKWDAEIAEALKESDTILVVLSNASVSSENVLDEVSYALEKKKRIIPLLLEQCELPFRMGRMQYLDFSWDYQQGLDRLLAALMLERKDVAMLEADKREEKKPVAEPKKPRPPRSAKKRDTAGLANIDGKAAVVEDVLKTEGANKKPKLWTLIIVIAAVVLVAFYFSHQREEATKDKLRSEFETAWKDRDFTGPALTAADKYYSLADKDEIDLALLHRGEARIMTGVRTGRSDFIQSGIVDLDRVDPTLPQATSNGMYIQAIGHYALGDYQNSLLCLYTLREGYEEFPGYRVNNLKGLSFYGIGNYDSACYYFALGRAYGDALAGENLGKYCKQGTPRYIQVPASLR